MDNEERRYLVRCPYCGHVVGWATILYMYNSSFWCSTCHGPFYVDPLSSLNPRENFTRYNDI